MGLNDSLKLGDGRLWDPAHGFTRMEQGHLRLRREALHKLGHAAGKRGEVPLGETVEFHDEVLVLLPQRADQKLAELPELREWYLVPVIGRGQRLDFLREHALFLADRFPYLTDRLLQLADRDQDLDPPALGGQEVLECALDLIEPRSGQRLPVVADPGSQCSLRVDVEDAPFRLD